MSVYEHPLDGRAGRLLIEVALPIVHDIRNDLATCHRIISHLDRADLEAVVCILAAYFSDGTPLGTREWWHGPDTAAQTKARQRDLCQALDPPTLFTSKTASARRASVPRRIGHTQEAG